MMSVEPAPAAPIFAGITVNTTVDEDNTGANCSLREAIVAANTDAAFGGCTAGSGSDVLTLAVTGTITLTSALPDLSTSMQLNGPGASQLTVSGNNSVRVFNVTVGSPGEVTFSGLTISNGTLPGDSNKGGGINNNSSGTVNVNSSIVSDNSVNFLGPSGTGGGIANTSTGIINVNSSIVSGNSVPVAGVGGGIANVSTGIINVTSSTVSGNVGRGGCGIFNDTGTVNVTNSTISGNRPNSSGSKGGGILNQSSGTVNVINSTLSGNSVGDAGGGIYNAGAGAVNVTNSTLSSNRASFGGGGIYNFGSGPVNLGNSIVALNIDGSSNDPDVSGAMTSLGHNLIGTNGNSSTGFTPGVNNANGDIVGTNAAPVNPRLGTLANNGGPTQTHALLLGSQALDSGSNTLSDAAGLTTDQRGPGFPRKADGPDADTTQTVDIGAFEAGASIEDITDKSMSEGTALSFSFNVGDAGLITSVTALSANGTLVPNQAANINVTGSGSTRTLNITPAANQAGTSLITVTVTSGSESMSDTFTLTVNEVNSTPSFTRGPDQTVAEDSGAQSVTNWATSISPGPGNESGQTLTFLVQNNTNPGLFSAGPAISATGTLSYTPAVNANGTATINIALRDNGGGADTSASQQFVITVTEVNDAPTAANDELSDVAEDSGDRTIPFAVLTANDSKGPADESGQTLIVKTVSNAVGGTVSIVGGNVIFTPTADYYGGASFQYTVEDNGTTNGAADPKVSAPATASFNITEVNDAPTAVNDTLSNVAEDSGPRTIAAATLTANDTKGPANESGQTLSIKTVSNPVGGTVGIVGGNVVFTPTADFNGPASFQYTVEDNGTTNGVANPKTSGTAAVSFNITAVADTPSVTNAVTNANTQTTSGLVISRNAADGAEVTHFKITGITGGTLFKNDGTTVINNGDFITFAEGNAGLKFTPGTSNGSFTIQASVSASDAGLGGGMVTATITVNPVGGVIRFSAANYSVAEGAGFTTITVERSGDTSQPVTVDYASSDHSNPADFIPCTSPGTFFASSRCDFTTAIGTLRFAAGETMKTFNVLISQDNYVEGTETLTLTLSNPTVGAVFGVPSTAVLSITDDATEPVTNPSDTSSEFVRSQYHDFLHREPDAPGLAFWTDNIEKCNDPARIPAGQTVPQCIDKQRESTAIAFFMSPEFQITGGFVYHLYKGSLTGTPNYDGGSPGRFPTSLEFMRDVSTVSEGIVVNNQISGAVVEANRNRLAAEFVRRPEFVAKYGGLDNTLYVQELFNTTITSATAAEKQALIDGLNNGAETRAGVLRKVVDGTVVLSENNVLFTTTYGQAFYNQENRRVFVFMEYIGYLRRNPDASGFLHWLSKLNQYNGDPFQAEMVRSFILSPEYRSRFGQP